MKSKYKGERRVSWLVGGEAGGGFAQEQEQEE